jgi:hypothetical protein
MPAASYYFWKWADNDLPGRPLEVQAALLRGELHPALQSFDARPLLVRLQEAAAEGRLLGEEWDWEAHPQAAPENARFVFVTCPLINASKERVVRFWDRFVPLGLSGYDEQGGHLIPCLRPKLNCFITGQHPYETAYDISEDDLPFLLRRIRPGRPEPWGVLENRRACVKATAKGRRYRVEWGEFPDRKTRKKFIPWRARDTKHLEPLGGRDDKQRLPTETDPDFITYADTLRIFQVFLRGEPRPAQYLWRKINARPQ